MEMPPVPNDGVNFDVPQQVRTFSEVVAEVGAIYPDRVGPKTQQKIVDRDVELSEQGSRLVDVLTDRLNEGTSIRCLSADLDLNAHAISALLTHLGISYPTREEAVARLWQDPTFRARNSKAQEGVRGQMWHDPEYRAREGAKKRELMRANLQDPSFRAKLREGSNTPEIRKKRSEQAKRQWEDPATREMHSRKMTAQVRQMWQDPEFRARSSQRSGERMRQMWQDPEMRARLEEAQRERLSDPEFIERFSAAVRKGQQEAFAADPQKRIERSEISRRTMTALWQDPAIREAWTERSRRMWDDPEFRLGMAEIGSARMTAFWQDDEFRREHAERTHQRWQDPDFRERMSEVSSETMRRNWQNQEFRDARRAAGLPTITGHRSDIGFFAQSMWEANFARVLMLDGRDFEVGKKLTLKVSDEFSYIFPWDEVNFFIDFITTNSEGRVTGYELMAHPLEDPDGIAKLALAQAQYPELNIKAVTSEMYDRLRKRFRARIEADPRFAGWETSADNVRNNPTKYAAE